MVSQKYQLKKYERTLFLFNLLDPFSLARRFTKNIQVSTFAILTLATNSFTFFDFFNSRYSFRVERREENSGAYGLRTDLSYLTRSTGKQYRAASFVAYFCPDIPEILFLICCSAHLTQEVVKGLKKRKVKCADGSSMKDMIPGEDKAFVFLSGIIRPFNKDDVNNIHLR